jgi:hypothetical protein
LRLAASEARKPAAYAVISATRDFMPGTASRKLEDHMIHWAEGLSPGEFEERLRWFARDVMPAFGSR